MLTDWEPIKKLAKEKLAEILCSKKDLREEIITLNMELFDLNLAYEEAEARRLELLEENKRLKSQDTADNSSKKDRIIEAHRKEICILQGQVRSYEKNYNDLYDAWMKALMDGSLEPGPPRYSLPVAPVYQPEPVA